MKEQKPIGVVTHYFGNLGVAIVKFNKSVGVGDRLRFKGATTDFEEVIKSMQFDHKEIDKAKKDREVGVKVGDKVRVGDMIFETE